MYAHLAPDITRVLQTDKSDMVAVSANYYRSYLKFFRLAQCRINFGLCYPTSFVDQEGNEGAKNSKEKYVIKKESKRMTGMIVKWLRGKLWNGPSSNAWFLPVQYAV